MKKLFITLIFIISAICMSAQITDPSTIQEGTAHAKWTGGTTDRFDVQMRIGDIFYDSDSSKYYYLECNFFAHQRPSDVYASASCYQEVSDGFFPPTAVEIAIAINDSLEKIIDLQDSTIAKLAKAINDSSSSTSAAVPVNYVIPNQGATVTWTSITSLTLSGLPIVISNNCQVVYVQCVLADSNRFYINGVGGINLSYSGGVVTIAGATESKPFPKTSAISVGLNVPQWALDFTYNAYNVIVLNNIEGISTGYLSAISDFEDESEATYSYAIPVGASNYNYADGYIKIYSAAAPDTIFPDTYVTSNPDAVTTDLTDWLKVTNLMGFDTVTATTDSIPWTLQDIYDNGYGVPERLMFRFRVVGGNDNAITDFYRTYSIK